MTSVKKDHAVIVQKACKRYGTKSNPYVILDELNMTVPKGCIYGLLGASGCGKTTLLSCIVGRKRLDSGEIRVLGGTPGSRGSGVPGPRVGYMPQGISLYGDFTIRETLKYFGWISKMTTEEVESKLAFYVDVLMLPHPEQKVKNLSGGQQRRVSLAAALIHEPELLILDEPTVGLDSLLRQNVWNHLIELTKDGGTTIIMTTHYIEEAKEAHLIAMLRGGYLLTEESPERLLTQFNCVSLEDVFLKLSVYQNMGKRRRSSISIGVSENIPIPAGVVNEAVVVGDEVSEISGEFGESISMSNRGHRLSISSLTNNVPPLSELPPEELPPMKLGDHFKFLNAVHMKALIWKNLLWMWRNISFMCVLILLPVTQSVLFYYTIGQPPQNLNLAIVNHELGSANEPCNFTQGCNSTKLSCYYLHFVQNLSFTLQYFDDDEAAKNQVRKGKAWAALIMAHNFSDAFRVRLDSPSYLQPWDLERSTVDVYQDISDVNIGAFVRIDLLTSFESFIRDLLISCDKNPDSYKLPLKWGRPIYGAGIPDFADFVIPGFVLSVAFFIAVSLTVLTIVTERSEGLMERSLVNGITGMELLFSHVATQFMVMCVQNGLFIIFCFPILGYDMHGSYLLLVVLDLLTGVCGMCFGFVVSCGCDSEFTAMYISLGSFFPVVNLCGMFWPIEGMHKVVKVISYLLPLTKSTESLRCILARGWGLEKSMVYEGFIATVVWILLFLTASILIIKFKKG